MEFWNWIVTIHDGYAMNRPCPNEDCHQPVGQPCRTVTRRERLTCHIARGRTGVRPPYYDPQDFIQTRSGAWAKPQTQDRV
jgi:hypothetical protein